MWGKYGSSYGGLIMSNKDIDENLEYIYCEVCSTGVLNVVKHPLTTYQQGLEYDYTVNKCPKCGHSLRCKHIFISGECIICNISEGLKWLYKEKK